MDMHPDPYESRFDNLSIKCLKTESGCSRGGCQPVTSYHLSAVRIQTFQNVLGLIFFLPLAKSDVVTWWERWEYLDLVGPPCFSCVISTLFNSCMYF